MKGLEEVEKKIGGEGVTIVIVSHADTLQILQAGQGLGLDKMGEFSSYRFKNGECRVMGEELPEKQEMEPPEIWKKGNLR